MALTLEPGRLMFELLLELYCWAKGIRPIMSADEILEVRDWLHRDAQAI